MPLRISWMKGCADRPLSTSSRMRIGWSAANEPGNLALRPAVEDRDVAGRQLDRAALVERLEVQTHVLRLAVRCRRRKRHERRRDP